MVVGLAFDCKLQKMIARACCIASYSPSPAISRPESLRGRSFSRSDVTGVQGGSKSRNDRITFLHIRSLACDFADITPCRQEKAKEGKSEKRMREREREFGDQERPRSAKRQRGRNYQER